MVVVGSCGYLFCCRCDGGGVCHIIISVAWGLLIVIAVDVLVIFVCAKSGAGCSALVVCVVVHHYYQCIKMGIRSQCKGIVCWKEREEDCQVKLKQNKTKTKQDSVSSREVEKCLFFDFFFLSLFCVF